MLKRESLYLDLIRFLAAVTVVIDHAPSVFNVPGAPRWGHQAVVVFYVLSGYVIARAAGKPGTNGYSFIIARLARLWSVLIPGLVLTVVCDFVGRHYGVNQVAYQAVPSDLPLIRIGAAVPFLSESWVSIQPMSDGVIWSLCAEFWYYMIFAAMTFTRPGCHRTFMLAAMFAISGFKAILLLPIWLFGVALHRSSSIRRLPTSLDVALFASSAVLIGYILATQYYDVPIAFMERVAPAWMYTYLAQVRVFWFDWLFGLLVFAHFLGARSAINMVAIERVANPILWCAGISFAMYLFHAPIEHLLSAFLPYMNGWVAIAITLSIIAVIGHPIEKTREWWTNALDSVRTWVTTSLPWMLTLGRVNELRQNQRASKSND